MQSGVFSDLIDFSFRDVVRVDTTNAFSLGMYTKHDLGGIQAFHMKEKLEHLNDEIHRGKIIVDQDDPV